MPKSAFTPYADESATLSVGGLVVENRLDRVTVSGDVDLTMDKAGLAHARRLKAVLDAVVAHLEAEPSLPDVVGVTPPTAPRDPFAQ